MTISNRFSRETAKEVSDSIDPARQWGSNGSVALPTDTGRYWISELQAENYSLAFVSGDTLVFEP